MNEINCKYTNSCYLSQNGKYIKKDMLIEMKYHPKDIYIKDHKKIFVFNDNIITKLTIWKTILNTIKNYNKNDIIYPMSNLKNNIILKEDNLIHIKKELQNTNNFDINDTIKFIIQNIKEEEKNYKYEIELVLIGYEDCLNDIMYNTFQKLFMKIYNSLNNNDNIKLNFIFYEYTLEEELKIHKYIVSKRNYKYNKVIIDIRKNDVNKIIKNNTKEEEIECEILNINKNINYKYKIPKFNLIRIIL